MTITVENETLKGIETGKKKVQIIIGCCGHNAEEEFNNIDELNAFVKELQQAGYEAFLK